MSHPLLKRAKASGTPVINGSQATLLWQGEQPPCVVGDFNGWTPWPVDRWSRIAAQLWACSLDFPSDAYVEYAFLAEPGDETRLVDPLNPRSAPDGLGHVNNYFYMPDARPTPLGLRGSGVPQGRLTRHRIESDWLLANGKRRVHLYSPPTDSACGSGRRQRRCPHPSLPAAHRCGFCT